MNTSLLIVIILLLIIALIIGGFLAFASVMLKAKSHPISDQIDAILPQIQCAQCGYPGCRPYADAIANGDPDITKCTPGGRETVIKIADILGIDVPPLEDQVEEGAMVAVIDEYNCIGCTKCIQACPFDAIIGTNKATHTVIPELCTGCKLCVEPCPTDCISMKSLKPKKRTFDPNLTIEMIQIRE